MSDDLTEIKALQQRTLTMLEGHVKLSDERHGDIEDMLGDHEKRIRKNERFRYKVIGWAAGAGILSASAAEFLKTKIGL